jgi:hypothetical protein
MDDSPGAANTPTTYLERARQRTNELETLVAEIEGLRADRSNNLGRIRSIGLRLRELADEQRADTPLWIDQNLHVLLWRKLDLQARRADLILTSAGRSLDALDAEYADIVGRGPKTTAYDVALMELTGEPFPNQTLTADSGEFVGPLTWVGRILGLSALASPAVLLAKVGSPIAGVVLTIVAVRAIKPLWGWLEEIFDEVEPAPPDPNLICPGYKAYLAIEEHTVAVLNASIELAGPESATTADLDRAIMDTLALYDTMQRINVPAAVTELHAAELAILNHWIGIFQTDRSGGPVAQAVRDAERLAEVANAEVARIHAKCRGLPFAQLDA